MRTDAPAALQWGLDCEIVMSLPLLGLVVASLGKQDHLPSRLHVEQSNIHTHTHTHTPHTHIHTHTPHTYIYTYIDTRACAGKEDELSKVYAVEERQLHSTSQRHLHSTSPAMPVKPVAEEPSATSVNAFTGGHEKEKDRSFRSSCFMVVMGCVEMRKETPRFLLSAAGDPALTRY